MYQDYLLYEFDALFYVVIMSVFNFIGIVLSIVSIILSVFHVMISIGLISSVYRYAQGLSTFWNPLMWGVTLCVLWGGNITQVTLGILFDTAMGCVAINDFQEGAYEYCVRMYALSYIPEFFSALDHERYLSIFISPFLFLYGVIVSEGMPGHKLLAITTLLPALPLVFILSSALMLWSKNNLSERYVKHRYTYLVAVSTVLFVV